MNNNMVTIGIPVYNVESYIRKCICSVLNQTYANIEVLIIDDCGTDKSIKIIEQMQNTHKRGKCIRIIKQPYNLGVSKARNTVVNNAKGKYVYFIDSDDFIEKETIEIMVAQAEIHVAEVVMSSLQTYNSTNDSCGDIAFKYKSLQVITKENEFANIVCNNLHENVSTCSVNILFRTDFIINHGLLFEGRNSEEFLFLSKYYSFVKRAVLMPNITYYYVIRENSLMGRQKRDVIPVSEIRERFHTDKKMTLWCSHLKDKPFYDTHCARVMKHKFRAVCVALRHRKRFSEWLSNDEIMQELKHPASFCEICRFKRYRIFNLLFYFLRKMPSCISIRLSYVMGKCLRWI